MKPFDPTKPCRTRRGEIVRHLITDINNRHKWGGLIATPEYEYWSMWFEGGYHNADKSESPNDLINIPEKHELWMNIYQVDGHCCSGGLFNNRDILDNIENLERIACIKVTFEEGEGL